MNEETMLQTNPNPKRMEKENSQSDGWKYVILGGVPGILMGAGSMYAGEAIAEEISNEKNDEVPQDVQVADVKNDLSFGEAFAAARAEVGPGGVFYWHGGIYNTYTAEEWNAMSAAEKNAFSRSIHPEVSPHDVYTPTDHHPDIAVHAVSSAPDDVEAVDVSASTDSDDDVHIVGYAEVEGHAAVALDFTGDGNADIAIIDVDDTGDLSDPDVLIDRQGNMATWGDLMEEQDPYTHATEEQPETGDTTNDDDLFLMEA